MRCPRFGSEGKQDVGGWMRCNPVVVDDSLGGEPRAGDPGSFAANNPGLIDLIPLGFERVQSESLKSSEVIKTTRLVRDEQEVAVRPEGFFG